MEKRGIANNQANLVFMGEADPAEQITMLLQASREGDPYARNRLIESLYGELRRIAGSLMRDERSGHTLQPTALVHELLIRLIGNNGMLLAENKSHFVFMATRAMRNLLVDHARGRRTARRGGEVDFVPIEPELDGANCSTEKLLAIHEALDRLDALNARQGRVAEMRIFGGFDVKEIAQALGVTTRTVDRDWQLAKAWLHLQLRGAISAGA